MAQPLVTALFNASSWIVHKCKVVGECTAMVVIILFAFVPIIGLFTWTIPFFVLERIIPIQFHGFILNIPLFCWYTIISLFIISITLGIAHFIEKQNLSNSHYFGMYLYTEIKNNLSIRHTFTTMCHLFGIIVFSAFCSFVFCVSPSLYLCALFWFIYEMIKNDINIKDDALQIRQHLYQSCFTLFDEMEPKFNKKISVKIQYLKQFAYHIFCVLLTIKHISDGNNTNILHLKRYIECLQNNCQTCDHEWKVKQNNLKDYRMYICIETGAILLIISHLLVFWIWTMYYSVDQVTNISIDFHSMTKYCQLLIYYIVEHSCIVIVFLSAAKMYINDINDYYIFEFFKLNNDTNLIEALDEFKIPENEDIFSETYYKLLYVYLNQLITAQTLKSCVKDHWLHSLLCMFCCGDKSVNILIDKELLRLLDECDIQSTKHTVNSNAVNDFTMHNEENNKYDNAVLIPMEENAIINKRKSVSDFAVYFNGNVNKLSSNIKCPSSKGIKKLIKNYVTFCCMK